MTNRRGSFFGDTEIGFLWFTTWRPCELGTFGERLLRRGHQEPPGANTKTFDDGVLRGGQSAAGAEPR